MTRETRAAYDAIADEYARLLPDLRAEAPLDLAVLDAFSGLARGDGCVGDLGCGAGRITSHLARTGLQVVGVDLSPGMVGAARAAHPELAFAAGDLCALPVRDAALAGALSWYSVINLPPEALPLVVAELARVTRRGAPALVAFQCGDGERVDRSAAYGREVPLTYYRHSMEHVAALLVDSGFSLHATLRRERWLPHETTPQAFVLAVR